MQYFSILLQGTLCSYFCHCLLLLKNVLDCETFRSKAALDLTNNFLQWTTCLNFDEICAKFMS